jgi:hypothetical protein
MTVIVMSGTELAAKVCRKRKKRKGRRLLLPEMPTNRALLTSAYGQWIKARRVL